MAHPHKVGLVFAAIIGGLHILWSLLVALGVAQALYDFILWAHMIHLQITIGPFDAKAAVTLVIITTISGYVIGYLVGWMWNRVHR